MEKDVEKTTTATTRHSLEKKNRLLNSQTKALEERMRNLKQRSTAASGARTRTLPKVRATSAPPRELPPAPRLGSSSAARSGSSLAAASSRGGSTVSLNANSKPASNVTSRIREREAEFTKTIMERDEHISRLKERLKVVSKRLTEVKEATAASMAASGGQQQSSMSRDSLSEQENGVELQSIIRQVTKERLQLERHLQIANDSLQRNSGVDLHRYLALEQANSQLRQQLDSLDLLQQEHRLVEIQYREKEEACRELMNTLKYKSALCEDLESQLAKVIEKNTELTIANSDLQRRVVELKDATEECETLKTTLDKVETECTTAKTEVRSLTGKVRNLECVLGEMHRAGENRREIERQHREALEALKRRQEEVEETATKKQAELIAQLEDKIGHLEREKRAQNERHTELILEMAELKKYGAAAAGAGEDEAEDSAGRSGAGGNLEIDEIMAKLEQDNKFLEEIEQRRAAEKDGKAAAKAGGGGIGSGGSSSPSTTGGGGGNGEKSGSNLNRAGSAITDSGFLSQSSLNGNGSSPTSRLGNGSGNGMGGSSGSLNRLPGLSKAEKIGLLTGGPTRPAVTDHQVLGAAARPVAIEERDGMIEIPGKGWTNVFIARYSYDPFQHSPNDSPEAELQVNAGDYILAWGSGGSGGLALPDEDGFYDGELLDGRRGLVPSNFVERLEGDELAEFHSQVVLGLGDCDDSVCTSIPQDLDFISSDEGIDDAAAAASKRASQPHFKKNKTPSSSTNYLTPQQQQQRSNLLPQYASCTDLDLTEDDEDDDGGQQQQQAKKRSRGPPPPRCLTLESQHNRSVVVGWSPPDGGGEDVEAYQVVVDGAVHSTVPHASSPALLRTTVGGVDPSVVHRISVKSVSSDPSARRRFSEESACTMVFGKDAPLAPTNVRTSRVTSTSCTVSWVPSNSNLMHAICVGHVEVKTVRPGAHRHTLAGLQPATAYRVAVRAKNLKAAMQSSSSSGDSAASDPLLLSGRLGGGLATSVEVKTLPRGLPEPPVDVRVEASSSSQGSLTVSWLPVTINPSGTSNGAPVLGYTVSVDGATVKEVDSGTADQVTLDLPPSSLSRSLTVRTRTTGGQSSRESEPCPIPPSATVVKDPAAADPSGLVGFSPARPREMLINYSGYPELDSDIGPSELSDIAEEPEEGLTTTDESGDDGDDGTITPKISNGNHAVSSAAGNVPAPSIQNPAYKPAWQQQQQQQQQQLKYQQHLRLSTPGSQFTAQPLTGLNSSSNSSSRQQQHASSTYIGQSNGRADPHAYRPTTVHVNGGGGGGVNNNKNSIDVTAVVHQAPSSSSSAVAVVNGNKSTGDRIRIFVALFDYDPQTMSPNPDACDEEPPFREGQLIKVVGDKDADGFYWGEAGARTGFVPCNMVSEVQVDDDHVAEELFREQQRNGNNNVVAASSAPGSKAKAAKSNNANALQNDRWGDIYDSTPARQKLALYDYDPTELSPNVDSEVELGFRTGDLVLVYGDMDDDGFFVGEIASAENGVSPRRGLVPSNFLTDVPAGYDPKQLAKWINSSSSSSASSNSQQQQQQQPRVLGQSRKW